jgi:hypothetical protein
VHVFINLLLINRNAMLDFFFNSYFVFFRNRMEKGASATVILMAIPLGLNVYMLLLIGLSFLTSLRSLGGPLFGLMGAVIIISLGLWLRHKYVDKSRYTILPPIESVGGYILFGITHYIFSILSFVGFSALLLMTSP